MKQISVIVLIIYVPRKGTDVSILVQNVYNSRARNFLLLQRNFIHHYYPYTFQTKNINRQKQMGQPWNT